jgi:hypothetical protein
MSDNCVEELGQNCGTVSVGVNFQQQRVTGIPKSGPGQGNNVLVDCCVLCGRGGYDNSITFG